MLILLSPAKIQNFKPQQVTDLYSMPHFMKEAKQLVNLMRQLHPTELSKLLDINHKLTELNYDRYFNWHVPFTPENAKQAALVFDGEVFRGLQAINFTADDFEFAQQHLIILSGLYGALRPLDLIQGYRLEVSSALKNENGRDLYAFWQARITKFVINALKNTQPQFIVNLASSEYFKSLNLANKKVNVIDVEFLEYKNDTLKPIVIYTKKARGLMARYLIKNKIENIEDIKGFADGGYWFNPHLSTERKLVFVR
jgi:cytoplasmic iron level regulating protein YaaA (DUF328/UPF0246 family)